MHTAQATLKSQALAHLAGHVSFEDIQDFGDNRFLLVLDREGRLLTGPSDLLRAMSSNDANGLQRWVPAMLELSRQGGGTLQFDSPLIAGRPVARHLAYASAPDEWGWTMVSVAPLSAGPPTRTPATGR